jgi:hypothetical protein
MHWTEATKVIADRCSAGTRAAHSGVGLIHRDIKPGQHLFAHRIGTPLVDFKAGRDT